MENQTKVADAPQTVEEARWKTEAKKLGIPLVALKPDSDLPKHSKRMDETYKALKLEGFAAQLRLDEFIRRLQKEQQQQQESGRIQQLPHLSEATIAALNEMAADYMTKNRTIRLSEATQGAKTDLMDMLMFPEKGASWPNKPVTLPQRVTAHSWLEGDDEDSEENRLAYMAYLRTMLQKIPDNYDLVDVQPDRTLLSVELFRADNMRKSRKISGTTDVAIAKSQHVRNGAVRNNMEALLELKTLENMKRKDHSPQVIGQHFAASYLNPNHAVVSVLTDLNTRWIFFWFALGDDDNDARMALYKLDLVKNHVSWELEQ